MYAIRSYYAAGSGFRGSDCKFVCIEGLEAPVTLFLLVAGALRMALGQFTEIHAGIQAVAQHLPETVARHENLGEAHALRPRVVCLVLFPELLQPVFVDLDRILV